MKKIRLLVLIFPLWGLGGLNSPFGGWGAFAQNIGINTPSPTTTLDVNGTIRIRGGAPAANKVLTSDINGLGVWANPPSTFVLPYSGTGSLLTPNSLFKIENLAILSGNAIIGIINSDNGTAVTGTAQKTNPTSNNFGVYGLNNSTNQFGYGVVGIHSGNGKGGSFSAGGASGIGVLGEAHGSSAIGGLFQSDDGIAVKGISDTKIGGFFSGISPGSYALVTDIGNVGIGTLTPTLSGLVVDKAVGNAHAIFGSNTAGLSLESNWPGISFNAYYNAGRKPLSNGFVGGMSMNPANGTLLLYNSATAGTTGTNIVGLERIVINNLGNVGIGTSSPASRLDIQGTTNLSHFFYGTTEDTYIRGGKATSNVIIGDVGNNIGIKTALPYYDLTFKSELGDKISFFGGDISANANHYGIGMQGYLLQFYVPSASESLVFGTGRSDSFSEKMRITGSGFVGIGINNPSSALAVTRGTGLNGTAVFYGTQHSSHFNYYTNEDTYIRGGKDNAKVFINDIGNLGQIQVGNATTPVGFKMSVDGKLICTELEVRVTPWPDYVFGKKYKLKPLPELENYIEKNGHLPNIPKAEDIENQSLALGNMAKLQMEKIEELTLYVIEINKRLQKVEEENKVLKAGNKIVSSKN